MARLITRRNLLFVMIYFLALLGFAIYVLVNQTPAEARLNSSGAAIELNLDDVGRLWISDYKAKEIWGVDPTSGSFVSFTVSESPVDARQAGGWLWWADGHANFLGRIFVTDGSFTEWQIPDAPGFLGTNLDESGRLYATDSSNPYLYRLDPDHEELCTYNLPGFGASNYMVRSGDFIWLDDWYDATLIRLNTGDGSLTWWSLPAGSSPFGISADTQGNIWYADQGLGLIAKLSPDINQLESYLLPKGTKPQMIVYNHGYIWYTDQSLPSIGRLDPQLADHTIITPGSNVEQLTPSCTRIVPSSSGKMSIKSGILGFHNTAYPLLINSGGWEISQLPTGSDPWGIVITDFGYVVDSGRQLLIRYELPQGISLTSTQGLETPQYLTPSPLPASSTSTPVLLLTQEPNPAYLPVIIKSLLIPIESTTPYP